VAQLDLSVRLPHVVEGEDSGNRHFQFTLCDEVRQLGEHRCGCGIRAALSLNSEPFYGIEIGNGIDLLGGEPELFHSHGDISTTEEI
jgi:hypothetical protein